MSSNISKLPKEAQELCKKYDLTDEDVIVTPRFRIILRQGIEKIMAKANIVVSEISTVFADPFEVIYKMVITDGKRAVTTTGEASVDRYAVGEASRSKTSEGESKAESRPDTVLLKKGTVMQNPPYLSAMAEKRGKSRGVLMLTDFYKYGMYGEDEADDFGKEANKHRAIISKTL